MIKIPTLVGIWKKLILILIDDLEGSKTSLEVIIEEMMEITKDLELEVVQKI
jgi:hypothetical protein